MNTYSITHYEKYFEMRTTLQHRSTARIKQPLVNINCARTARTTNNYQQLPTTTNNYQQLPTTTRNKRTTRSQELLRHK